MISCDANLERLPPELLIPILMNLSGLESLDSLLQASPAAFRVFDANGADIFESVFSAAKIHPTIASLIRITAYIRNSSLPPHVHDLSSLRNCIVGESMSYEWNPPRWPHPPCPLPSALPATVMRGILASHRKIVHFGISCLEYYLGRFNALRPEHLADKDFYYDDDDGTTDSKYDYVGAWQLNPPREPFPRVLRAFWRLELFKSVRIAIDAGRLGWSPDVQVHEFTRREVTTNVLKFYHAVEGYVAPTGSCGWPQGHYIDDDDPRLGTGLQHDIEAELIQTIEAYVADNKHRTTAPNASQHTRDRPTPAPLEPQDLEASYDVFGATLRFYYKASRPNDHWGSPSSPIRHVAFEPFRRFGFAIWDEKRMAAAGFLSKYGWDDDFEDCVTAWRSILDKEMLDEIAEENVRHHISDSEQTDSDATDPGDIVLPRWVTSKKDTPPTISSTGRKLIAMNG
ncbi:hypothetical protein PG993_004992 [Apiospora rasikravindrae]|uniref:F-box domain-containing protein n=1 Tax=Apiospora rasikravindrae TaxID=990691 RepID=A0ABR1TEB8_9PEZI